MHFPDRDLIRPPTVLDQPILYPQHIKHLFAIKLHQKKYCLSFFFFIFFSLSSAISVTGKSPAFLTKRIRKEKEHMLFFSFFFSEDGKVLPEVENGREMQFKFLDSSDPAAQELNLVLNDYGWRSLARYILLIKYRLVAALSPSLPPSFLPSFPSKQVNGCRQNESKNRFIW